MRVAALLLLLSGVAAMGAGCGGAGESSSPAALSLQREDLVAVSRALQSAESSIGREVATTKSAWPLVAGGLPASIPLAMRLQVAAAAARAREIAIPPLLTETRARELTGPAAGIAGLFRSFSGLAERGWTLTEAAIKHTDGGSPGAAQFERENVGLYIESIYDAHFDLAQIGKQLRDGYRKLGGPAAFGSALSQGEVDALARVHSERAGRLHPHVGVRFGS